MLRKYILSFGLSLTVVGLLVSLLAVFISGEFGSLVLEGSTFVYRTFFGSVNLLLGFFL